MTDNIVTRISKARELFPELFWETEDGVLKMEFFLTSQDEQDIADTRALFDHNSRPEPLAEWEKDLLGRNENLSLPDNISNNVARGARLLDEHFPGWHKRMDLNILDMEDGTRCAAAQASGKHYSDAMEILGWANAQSHGFNVAGGLPLDARQRDLKTLTLHWKRVVLHRR